MASSFFPHPLIPFYFNIQADGYEKKNQVDLRLDPNKIADITMTRAEPVSIYVISGETGKPVQGATIHLAGKQTGVNNFSHGGDNPSSGSTNSEGMLQLTDLRHDTTYHYIIRKHCHPIRMT